MDSDQKIARLEKLLEISRTLSSNLNLDSLLASIVDTAKQMTQTEDASILLLDEGTGSLYFEATTSLGREALLSESVPLDGSAAGWIVTQGRPLILDNLQKEKRHYEQPEQKVDFVTRNLVGVPLQVKDKTIGVLEVLNSKSEGPFSDDNLDTLTILAAAAAVAIENARLFEQSDQIATIVHELRTPITSIVGYSELLLKRSNIDPQDKTAFIEIINREAEQLRLMVNNFLDLARLETRRRHLKIVPTCLNNIISDAVRLLMPQAEDHAIDLRCALPDQPINILADPQYLKRVFINLISNAIKYNYPSGHVDISIVQHHTTIDVLIADTGVGIPPVLLNHIFDKFYRVADQQESVTGSGLGLAIVKEILEAHGGTIRAESVQGHGSTFTVTLPL